MSGRGQVCAKTFVSTALSQLHYGDKNSTFTVAFADFPFMFSFHRLELRLFITCAFVWLRGAQFITPLTIVSTCALPTAIGSE